MDGRAPDTLERGTAWTDQAACRGVDPDTFTDARAVGAARAICARCPVTRQCLDDILRIEGGAAARSRLGVYAGLTPSERRKRYERGRGAS